MFLQFDVFSALKVAVSFVVSNCGLQELFLMTLMRLRQFQAIVFVQESGVLGVQYVSDSEVLDKRLLKRFGHQVELVSMPSLAADQVINRVFKGA